MPELHWPIGLDDLVVGGFLVSTFSLVGVAAVWGLLDPQRRIRSWLPLTSLLILTGLIPAHELVLAFGVQILTLLVISAIWFLLRRRSERCVAGSAVATRQAGLQFSLQSLMALMVATAMMALEIVPIWRLEDRLDWVTIGMATGLLTALAASVALVRTRSGMIVTALSFVAFEVGVVVYFRGDLLFPALVWPCIALWLRLVRATGCLVGRDSDEAPATSPQKRKLTRAITAAVGLLIALPATLLYYPLARNVTAPHPPIPQPNGFDQLLEATKKLDWSSVSRKAWSDPSPEGFRTFVETQRGKLAACRATLDTRWQVPFYGDGGMLERERHDKMWDAARAFQIQSRVDAVDGRTEEAVAGGLAGVRLGAKLANHSLLLDALVGWAITSTGHGRLFALLPQLDAEQCRRVGQELERCDRDRDPLSDIMARDEAWEQESSGWLKRLVDISQSLATPDDAAKILASCDLGCRRSRAANALLRSEFAIRAYQLTTSESPDSLEQLVPDYLAAVPADPWGSGPLKYVRTSDGYLLYSVYRDGHDDGGLKIPSDERRSGQPEDAFADTLIQNL